MNKTTFKKLLFTAYCLLLTFFTGCASVTEYVKSQDSSQGQLTIFFQGREKISTEITFELIGLNIVSEEGTSAEILSSPVTVSSLKITGRQLLLGERYLPEGRYKKLRFMIKQASLNREGRIARLSLPPDGIVEVDINITVARNQNTSLFISWDPDASIVDGYLFSPVFTVRGQSPELSTLLIYVTNENSNNVSAIYRQTGEVAATIMVGSKPRGIAVSPGKENQKVYVVNTGSNSVSVIDPTTHKVDVEIPVRFGRDPEGIAVFGTSAGKELIFIANYGSNNVSIIDGSTYQEIEKINVGDGPISIAVDPPAEDISATRFLSFDDTNILRRYREKYFNVYVANRNSKNVSIIRMDLSSGRPDEVVDVPVEWSPIALEVDYKRAKVYVANFDYDNISVIDILQIIKGNTKSSVSAITDVGTSIIGIVADPDFDRLYLLKESSAEIIVIRPFSETFGAGATTMVPVVGTVRVGDSPRSIILDSEGRKLYTVNRGANTVSVVDKTTMREEKVIPVGEKPYGIAMFP